MTEKLNERLTVKDRKLLVLQFLLKYIKKHIYITPNTIQKDLIEDNYNFYREKGEIDKLLRSLGGYINHLLHFNGIERMGRRTYRINDTCQKLIYDTINKKIKFSGCNYRPGMDLDMCLDRIENTKHPNEEINFLMTIDKVDPNFRLIWGEFKNG